MYQFKVEGLHCSSCVDALQEKLKLIDAQGKVEADLEQERLGFETSASPEQIKRMIEEAGYKMVVLQTKP